MVLIDFKSGKPAFKLAGLEDASVPHRGGKTGTATVTPTNASGTRTAIEANLTSIVDDGQRSAADLQMKMQE